MQEPPANIVNIVIWRITYLLSHSNYDVCQSLPVCSVDENEIFVERYARLYQIGMKQLLLVACFWNQQ